MKYSCAERWNKLGKQNIHVITDAIADPMANIPHMVEPEEKYIPDVTCQYVRGFESLPEHSHQGMEVGCVVMAHGSRESGRALAVENHRLGHASGIAERLFVVGDRLLSLGCRSILLSERVWPEPPINGFPVRPQHVLAQTKTSMKEYLIVPVRIIEILNQAQQRWAIKTREFCFNVRPCGF